MSNGTPIFGMRKYKLAWGAMIGTFVVVAVILLLGWVGNDEEGETLRHAITKVGDMWPWAVGVVLGLYGGANVATHFAKRENGMG